MQTTLIPDDLKATWVKLNLRQRRFVLAYFDHDGNAPAAYIVAGYQVRDGNVAAAAASRLLSTVKVSAVIYGILKAHHLTPDYANVKLFELLQATETKFFAHEGRVIERHEVVAWGPRATALDMLHKMQGRYKSNGNGSGETHYHYTVNLQASEEELARDILAAIRNRPALPAHQSA